MLWNQDRKLQHKRLPLLNQSFFIQNKKKTQEKKEIVTKNYFFIGVTYFTWVLFMTDVPYNFSFVVIFFLHIELFDIS